MTQSLSKICSDSLRTLAKEKYDIKLKSTHAHELVAAYFGYASNNAMLADTKYPIENLRQAEIVVMTSDAFINQRRSQLSDISSELPDSYTLGEAVYLPLFSDDYWASPFPPFRGFDKAAKYLVENSDAFQAAFKKLHNIPMHHVIAVQKSEDAVTLSVFHTFETPTDETLVAGKTTIEITRVAGRIGYGKPQMSVEMWTGGARRTLKSLGVQL